MNASLKAHLPRLHCLGIAPLFSLVALFPVTQQVHAGGIGQYTYVTGKASIDSGRKSKPKRVKRNDSVRIGQSVFTGPKSKLEMTLRDGSVIRIGPRSRLLIETASFRKTNRKSIGLHLPVGQLWARVSKSTIDSSKFEVRVDRAISVVKGTTFAVRARADTSAIVRVYAGSVGVRPALGEMRNRRRIAGPSQIDRRQWEEIVAGAMNQIKVSSGGEISPAEEFGELDGWAKWNQVRDGSQKTR